jgi:hypothetical protein
VLLKEEACIHMDAGFLRLVPKQVKRNINNGGDDDSSHKQSYLSTPGSSFLLYKQGRNLINFVVFLRFIFAQETDEQPFFAHVSPVFER